MSDNRTLLERRRGLALEIAAAVRAFVGDDSDWCDYELAGVIDAMIPMTNVEAEAALDAAIPEPLSEERIAEMVHHATVGIPSAVVAVRQLRAALGLPDDTTAEALLAAAVEAAVERDKFMVALDNRILFGPSPNWGDRVAAARRRLEKGGAP